MAASDPYPTIPEPTTAREVLDIIDRFLSKGHNPTKCASAAESYKLRCVLAALRGPDHEHEDYKAADLLKMATTAVIRAAALPLLYDAAPMAPQMVGVKLGAGMLMRADTKVVLPWGSNHFIDHIMSAAACLDLMIQRGPLPSDSQEPK